VTDGPLWGVTNVTNFVISNLTADHVYTLTGIELVRKDHATATFLPAMVRPVADPGSTDVAGGWVLQVPQVTSYGTTTTTRVRRFLDRDTDGRRQESEDIVWVHIETESGATTDEYGFYPLNILIGNSSYPQDGWTVTDFAASANEWLSGCQRRFSLFTTATSTAVSRCSMLLGAASISTHRAHQYAFDLDTTSGLTIPAQMLSTAWTGIPAVAMPSGLRAGIMESPSKCGWRKILRNDAIGVVIDSNEKRLKTRPGQS